MQILKFRAFSSKERQGFILLKSGPLPPVILQDLLFQLFQPLFKDIFCPQIYFFSSTDEILKAEDLHQVKDYIYVHFLQRVQKYVRGKILTTKIKIGRIGDLSTGLKFSGTNLYIFSQKQYIMYGQEVFRQSIEFHIQGLSSHQTRKAVCYQQAMQELNSLKDNFEMIQLKNQIKTTVDKYREKVAQLQTMNARYLKLKSILAGVLKGCGINIMGYRDLR